MIRRMLHRLLDRIESLLGPGYSEDYDPETKTWFYSIQEETRRLL